MKISLVLAGLCCAILLSACTAPRGGCADASITAPKASQSLTQQTTAQPDYRDTLAEPGWF